MLNAENDRKINVLRAFGVGDEKNKPSAEEISQYFSNNIREVFINEDGSVSDMDRAAFELMEKENPDDVPLPLYIWSEEGKDVMYGFPMKGMGLWSTVHSYIALKEDLSTIKGVTFYGHQETPGLGGECSKPWFMNQFANKIVYINGQPVAFEVVKGKVSDRYEAGSDKSAIFRRWHKRSYDHGQRHRIFYQCIPY